LKQTELTQLLASCHQSGELFSQMQAGVFGENDNQQLDTICTKIESVISENLEIEKGWLNLVRTLPLRLEIAGYHSDNESIRRAAERLRAASVEHFYLASDAGLLPQLDEKAEELGKLLASDHSYLSMIRVQRKFNLECADALVELLYGLRDIAASPTISRALLAELVTIPYELFWNRHYFSGVDLDEYDKTSEKIERALNFVLGTPKG
jgi:hypothetical protein